MVQLVLDESAEMHPTAARLARAQLEPGRLQVHRLGRLTLLDDSYNSSPAAASAALAALAAFPRPHTAVLGDMLELGPDSARLHAGLAEPILDLGIDVVFTVGREMRALHEALPRKHRGAHAETAAAMADLLPERLAAGDIVTVKGSYGTRMREVVARLLSGQAAVRVKG